MTFGVVVCKKCKFAKGVDLATSKTKCTRCGKSIDMKKAKVFAKTESQSELSALVGELNAKLKGGLEEYHDLLVEVDEASKKKKERHLSTSSDLHSTVASRLADVPGRTNKAVEAARLLTQLGSSGTFSEDDLMSVLILSGSSAQDAGKYLKELFKGDMIYEPAPGRYKFL